MATYSANVTLKVQRAVAGPTVVESNGYAEVTFIPISINYQGNSNGASTANTFLPPITRIFGPGQSIPASFTSTTFYVLPGGPPVPTTFLVTYSLSSGVVFINSP